MLLFSFSITYGQEENNVSFSEELFEKKIAIGVSGGTNGFGVDVARNVHKHFNVAIGYNYFKIEDFSQTVSYDGQSIKSNINLDIQNIDLRIEYLPFTGSSFKLVAGLAYMMSNGVRVIGQYNSEVTFGEVTMTPDDIGEIRFQAEWEQISPYFGIGLGRAVPKRRVGFGFDIGTYYIGKPKIDFVGTEMLSDMSTQQAQIQSNMEDYNWFPVFKLRLAVRIN
ncbi:hypothetical protein NH26_20695 [Flammeovirga pacifica]|uniref:Outer membrane protein beta-barrel domain-containing protein n=2 Tax=Flammeovirga pacifica TaxID=915059 RepID=A0A1S1YSN1_FLAPC|nr:hypothetical protein NH26_20695 [Flammeovirga pacifica]